MANELSTINSGAKLAKTGLTWLTRVPGFENMLPSGFLPGLGLATSGLDFGQSLASGNPGQIGMSGLNLGMSGLSAAASGLLGPALQALTASLAPALSVAALPLYAATSIISNAQSQQANRVKNLYGDMSSSRKTMEHAFPWLASGANQSGDPADAYGTALQGMRSADQLAHPFSTSNDRVTVPGPFGSITVKFPDYSNQIEAERSLLPFNVANVLKGHDALLNRGDKIEWGQDVPGNKHYDPLSTSGNWNDEIGKLFEMGLPYGVPVQGGHQEWGKPDFTWDDPSASVARSHDTSQPMFQRQLQHIEPDGTVTMMDDPNWTIRSDIQDKLNAIKPNEVVSGLSSIYGELNPNYAQSQLGQLLNLGGGSL